MTKLKRSTSFLYASFIPLAPYSLPPEQNDPTLWTLGETILAFGHIFLYGGGWKAFVWPYPPPRSSSVCMHHLKTSMWTTKHFSDNKPNQQTSQWGQHGDGLVSAAISYHFLDYVSSEDQITRPWEWTNDWHWQESGVAPLHSSEVCSVAGPGDKILNTAQSGSSDLLEYSSPKKISNEDSKTYQHMSVHVAGLRVESKAKEMQTKMNKESERLRRTWMLKKSYWVKGCQERQDLPPSNWTPIPYKSVQCS